MARNAFALALLAALALAGCSSLKGAKDDQQAQAQAKTAALRARTDSLRKARRLADSLAQVRYTACADSVRAELIKPAVVVKKRRAKSRKAPPAVPSKELIAQAQSVCGAASESPKVAAASDTAARKTTVADSSASRTTMVAATAPSAPPAGSAKAPAAALLNEVVDSAALSDSLNKARETEMTREMFAYSGSTRDPFNSLFNMEKSGPEVADLKLVGIYHNMRTSSGSVAVFRDKTGKRHKLRSGDQLGRSRVVQIRDRDVVFIIEDFGFERQETLSLRKQEDVTP